mmetsp:Transcript_3104/g.4220  ORF Transcript_3104/g.4220 Transcript_3104/m.4220 type:complete len:104 (+) Transcript_3104:634-945(+)
MTKSVPQTNGFITRTGNNVCVVCGEGNGQDILCVPSLELNGAFAIVKVPNTKSVVPRSGKSIVTIGGNSYILNEVAVPLQPTKHRSVFILLAITILIDPPNDH